MAQRRWRAVWVALACALPMVAPAAEPVVLRSALWDANQRPMYAQCARAFEAAHPGVTIRLEQVGWDDYWTALATGFISNTAPDVFTNHVAKFSEFVLNGVVTDLAPLIARDRVPVDIYEDGLLGMWQHQGRQYALPTDWDTVALAVNLAMVRAAGLNLQALRQLDWNPRDGGSFARAVARLSVDEHGRRGDEPGFDARRVKVYGFQLPGGSGMMGQSQWSGFAASTGWRYQDKPWDPALRYDDPRFIATIDWFASLPGRGWSASPDRMGRLGTVAMFFSGLVAMVPEGSWMVGHYNRHAKVDYARGALGAAHVHAQQPGAVGVGRHPAPREGLGLGALRGLARVPGAHGAGRCGVPRRQRPERGGAGRAKPLRS
jgi:multiple sugar transport system substrate-binding protein